MAEQKLSALEEANARERRIILEGPENPDKFKMPDGTTFAETRRKIYEGQVKEGAEQEEIHSQRIREQSTENDPLYKEGAKAVSTGPGTFHVQSAPSSTAPSEQPEKAQTTAPSDNKTGTEPPPAQ